MLFLDRKLSSRKWTCSPKGCDDSTTLSESECHFLNRFVLYWNQRSLWYLLNCRLFATCWKIINLLVNHFFSVSEISLIGVWHIERNIVEEKRWILYVKSISDTWNIDWYHVHTQTFNIKQLSLCIRKINFCLFVLSGTYSDLMWYPNLFKPMTLIWFVVLISWWWKVTNGISMKPS